VLRRAFELFFSTKPVGVGTGLGLALSAAAARTAAGSRALRGRARGRGCQPGEGRDEILQRWKEFSGKPQALRLPSAPTPFLQYFEDEARPQTRLDRDAGSGQAVTIGRLRTDAIFDWRFVALSHNTVRGAAGGAVLTAELLAAEKWIEAK
jgi:aspartate-semialdehyde dehydrogenase